MLWVEVEGIASVKWLRRIEVVDRFYMTYNDYGHLRRDPDDAALNLQEHRDHLAASLAASGFSADGTKYVGPGEASFIGWTMTLTCSSENGGS